MDVFVEDVAQRVVEDVGGGVVEHRGVAAFAVEAQLHMRALGEVGRVAAQDAADVQNRAVVLAGIRHFHQGARRGLDHAAVAYLAAALRIEGSFGGGGRHAGLGPGVGGGGFGGGFV